MRQFIPECDVLANRVVHKYVLDPYKTEQSIKFPFAGTVLLVERQHTGFLAIWVEVDADNPPPRLPSNFKIVGTGHQEIKPNDLHVTSWQDGMFVWHLYFTGTS
jgi:hypothetical protein